MNASSLSSPSGCWAEDLGAEPVEADGVTPAVDRCPVVRPSAHDARLSLERREHPVGLGPGAAIDAGYDTIHVSMLPDRRWP
jgi:hypothetical protein